MRNIKSVQLSIYSKHKTQTFMNISKSTKHQIIEAARQYMQSNNLSQDSFSEHVKKMNGGQGFSVAYLNDLLKNKLTTGGKHTPIDDKYFLRIAKAIKLQVKKSYRFHHDTDNYIACMNVFGDARDTCMPYAIDGGTGDGKSYAATEYAIQFPKNTYIVRCDGDLTAKSFFVEMAHSLGMAYDGPVYGIRKNIINKLKNEENPLLIIDEAENLKDRAWESMKRIMDDLKGYCGIVFIGANEFQAMLQKKSDRLKACFPQILRRIKEGGFKQLYTLTVDDVVGIAKPYGVHNKTHVKGLFDTCRNMGELSSLLERILREHDSTGTPVEDLIELYCNVQRKMKVA